MPVLVFLGLSVLDLSPMYATDRRQTDVRRASLLNVPGPMGIDTNNDYNAWRMSCPLAECLHSLSALLKNNSNSNVF